MKSLKLSPFINRMWLHVSEISFSDAASVACVESSVSDQQSPSSCYINELFLTSLTIYNKLIDGSQRIRPSLTSMDCWWNEIICVLLWINAIAGMVRPEIGWRLKLGSAISFFFVALREVACWLVLAFVIIYLCIYT